MAKQLIDGPSFGWPMRSSCCPRRPLSLSFALLGGLQPVDATADQMPKARLAKQLLDKPSFGSPMRSSCRPRRPLSLVFALLGELQPVDAQANPIPKAHMAKQLIYGPSFGSPMRSSCCPPWWASATKQVEAITQKTNTIRHATVKKMLADAVSHIVETIHQLSTNACVWELRYDSGFGGPHSRAPSWWQSTHHARGQTGTTLCGNPETNKDRRHCNNTCLQMLTYLFQHAHKNLRALRLGEDHQRLCSNCFGAEFVVRDPGALTETAAKELST